MNADVGQVLVGLGTGKHGTENKGPGSFPPRPASGVRHSSFKRGLPRSRTITFLQAAHQPRPENARCRALSAAGIRQLNYPRMQQRLDRQNQKFLALIHLSVETGRTRYSKIQTKSVSPLCLPGRLTLQMFTGSNRDLRLVILLSLGRESMWSKASGRLF